MKFLFKSKSNPKVLFYLVVFGLFDCYTAFVTTLISALWRMQPAYQCDPLNLLDKINQLIVCCYGYRM